MRSLRNRCLAFTALLLLPQLAQAQGLQLFGIGTVNRSMGGAATAAPIEAIGALAYNPATLTALDNQLSVGAEFCTPIASVNSSMPPILGGGSGQTDSNSGWTTIPSVGLSWRATPDSPITYGFGLFGIAGYSVNYPSSTTNPILYPQVPGIGHPTPGFGNVYANVSILEIIPTVAFKVSDRLSLSAGPTIQSAQIIASPFAFTAPNVNGYPTGSGTETSWGMGLQVGAFWQGDSGINLGASYKSPQWFLPFNYHGTDANGLPRDFNLPFTYPQIVSLGGSYTGIERWLFASDVRYFDWKNSGISGYPAQFSPNDFSLAGLGWRSTWSVSLGSQYQLTDAVALRAGYAFSQSPITDATAGFNVGTPLILQQSFNVGSTLRLSKALAAHIAYIYQPQNSVNGPIQSPLGPVPGSNVGYTVSAHAISLGLTASF